MKRLIFIYLLINPILAAILSFTFKLNSLYSVILFLVIPSILLSYIGKRYVKKISIFSLSTIPAFITIDYIAHISKQWLVDMTSFEFKILGVVPIEDILWVVFLNYLTLMFYEVYLDKSTGNEINNKKFKYMVSISVLSLIVTLVLKTLGFTLYLDYFYLLFGIVLILIPLLAYLLRKKTFVIRLIKLSAVFMYITFVYEIVALTLGWWVFPAEGFFIARLELFNTNFPLEELVFWILLLAAATVVWYEYFDDDNQ